MKCISKPTLNPAEVLDACANGVSDHSLAMRLTNARPDFLSLFEDYECRASSSELFLFKACSWGNGSQTIINNLNKNELNDLYSSHMVSEKKPARKYYDKLLMLAHLGKCPYCGFGQASTLDHFLPKARYPAFSVLSFNLVPSCSDCNYGKGFAELTQENQMLHPYFEGTEVEARPWLFSEVIKSNPATVRYFVQPPTEWSLKLTQRIKNHFNDLQLERRYGVEAASEIAGLSYQLEDLKTPEDRQIHLSIKARAERKIRTNSWQAALYDALASSAWYQESGFRVA
jgi:5-methylcytosine-specific restriction endonuclease McrA